MGVSTSGGSEPSVLNPRASFPGCSSSKSQPTRVLAAPRSLRASSCTYALISTDDAAIGFDSPPRTMIPYSVSIPRTFCRAIGPDPTGARPGRRAVRYPTPTGASEVLARGHPLDRATALGLVVGVVLDDRAHIDDALALLARDLRPVVGVGWVGAVFVLLVLLVARLDEVGRSEERGVGKEGVSTCRSR